MNEAFIVDAVRLPRALAKKDGAYADLKPVDLLAPLFGALSERNNVSPEMVEDVILGCSTQSGDQGANLAKIAALYAGWSDHVSGVTINRFCCSGLDALNLAASKVMSGMESLVVAGGIEQLSRVPMFADRGAWYSDPEVMEKTRFMHMGLAADLIAQRSDIERAELDEWALNSHRRAEVASNESRFAKSLIPIKDAEGKARLSRDEAIRPTLNLEGLAALPASFEAFVADAQKVVERVYPELTLKASHSVGTSPSLVDGASLLLVANAASCKQLGLKPRARIRHYANASAEPVEMLTGHLRATEKLFHATGLKPSNIDLWEINESFAASVIHYRKALNIPLENINVNGGAIAMGHPLGATGGNLISTVLDELERRELCRGLVAIPGGAGVGVATLIARCA
jgi:acetyl-CoA C-acetyltransferase